MSASADDRRGPDRYLRVMSDTSPGSSGLRVHRSNRVEFLAVVLAHNLSAGRGPGVDPMRPDHVAVGNRGTERWLAHQLAGLHKVCAHVAFPFPATVVQALVDWVLGPEPGARRWSEDAVQWVVLEELTRLDPDDALWAPLQSWIRAEPPHTPSVVEPRLLGLARQVADMLDRLSTVRPEWMVAWANDEVAPLPPEVDAWQPALWRRVVARLGPHHRAARLLSALDHLERGAVPDDPPEVAPLHVFGLSALPPVWVQLLAAAARHLPVDLYMLTPSDQFWDDVRRGTLDLPSPLTVARDRLARVLEDTLPSDAPVGPGRTRPNPMLATFGRVARDFQAVLERLPEGYRDDTALDAFSDPVPESSEPSGPRAPMLSWLQSDILHMRHPADHKAALEDFERRRVDPTDTSLQLHACYGLHRQVEVLRDVILELLAHDDSLQPRDITVMCPDVAAVAPLVSAIFGRQRGRGAPPAVPFRITDRTVGDLNPVAEVVERLLAMTTERLDAPTVLDFLALEPVRMRFGLEVADLPAAAALVRASGARWGRDADHRVAVDQPDDPMCTWRFGLERLALGLVMADHPDAELFAGVRPEDAAVGEDAVLVGRLLEFMAALSAELADLAVPRSPAEWGARLATALDRLVAPVTPAGFFVRQVREAAAALAVAPVSDHTQAMLLDARAVAAWLSGRFAVDGGPPGQQTGAVTVCSLLPQRGVPSRVIVLLGMDEGAFPRQRPSLGFDPTLRAPRVGDRDPRDEDRYLLLEALLAARDHFVVLWTGRDLRTNEALAPAVPVGELLDVVDASFLPPSGWTELRRWLVVEHPLQPFSVRNLKPGGLVPAGGGLVPHRLAGVAWSFDGRLPHQAAALAAQARPSRSFWPAGVALPEPVSSEAIELSELGRFWRQPGSWLMERGLGVWLRERDTSVPDREPVELDALEQYALKRDLAGVVEQGGHHERLLVRRRAAGQLPPGGLGELVFEEAWSPVQAASRLLPVADSVPPPTRIDLQLDGLELVGSVSGRLSSGELPHLIVGVPDGRKLREVWLQAVACTAMGAPTTAVVAWTGSSKVKPDCGRWLPFSGDAAAARAWLAWLLRWTTEGRRRPLRFFGRTSWAFAEAKLGRSRKSPRVAAVLADDPTHAEALATGLKRARPVWFGSDRMVGDRSDPALERLFPDRCPAVSDDDDDVPHDEFVELAVGFYAPLMAAEVGE